MNKQDWAEYAMQLQQSLGEVRAEAALYKQDLEAMTRGGPSCPTRSGEPG